MIWLFRFLVFGETSKTECGDITIREEKRIEDIMKLIALIILVIMGAAVINSLDNITYYVDKISIHTEHCTHKH